MHERGRRTKELPAPPHVVWADLVERRAEGTRAWLELRDDERRPEVLSSVEGRQVVWSSLWPERPDDRIELTITPDGTGGSRLEFVWLAADPDPAPATVGHLRRRLNELLYADLRYSYGQ
ncbi:hypothetical protein ACFJIY_25680 [Pimelobacter simplex]|uniref:hypothetical protein n=1 Tax=Nocardioides simplex TaxID=2045 RepID=UPI00366FD2C6